MHSPIAQSPLLKPARTPMALALLLSLTLASTHAQDDDWSACVAQLARAAPKQGVRAEAWQRWVTPLQPQVQLLDKLNHQPEFKLPTWDYLASLVDDERVQAGLAAMQREDKALAQAQARFGVDVATVAAVWGVESNFGQRTGAYPIIESLLTLSCMGRRQSFFRGELYAALRIVQSGDVSGQDFTGSWAGAFGQTQFMPSTFERLAVDLDGDGRRDLMTNNADALGSTAHFLQRAGWSAALPWGVEVKPITPAPERMGRRVKRPAGDWAQQGIAPIDGRSLQAHGITPNTPTALIQPEAGGPMFLVTRNFDALYSYNASENYALAIAHLADRLRGGGDFVTPWPTDDAGLSRAQKREIQIMLIARGHDIGAVDGALGERSRAAIRLEQARLGQVVNGRAGQRLYTAMKKGH